MATHVYSDDAPFSVPSGVSLHYTVEVADTAIALTATTDLVTSAAHVVPSYQNGNDEPRWPKALYLCHVNPAADVWVTWDGQDPVAGAVAPIGVKVPPTYPSLRIPAPAAIKAGTIKIISDQAAGTPIVLVYEF